MGIFRERVDWFIAAHWLGVIVLATVFAKHRLNAVVRPKEWTVGKKSQKGLAKDLFDIAAHFPWWVGCALAVIAFWVLHVYAAPPMETPSGVISPEQVSALAVGALSRTLAGIGQFLVPGLFLAGALASYLGRRKRVALRDAVATNSGGEVLQGLNWREFEILISEAFRQQGYSVEERGGAGADGGVDLVLRRGTEKFLVQCKHWRAQRVAVAVVRELYGVMAAEHAAGGLVVTSGTFTSDAEVFANGRNIQLVNGKQLAEMLSRARASAPSVVSARAEASPHCPKCQNAMVRRVFEQGTNSGKEFLGCSAYPRCRGVREI